MSRRIAMVALALLLLGGLSACGRKGALEPAQSSVTMPGTPIST
ncbi:MAG: lipoprotein [Alphaproteobacteria bacterium]